MSKIAIRVAVRAPIEVLLLLFESRAAVRSWLSILEQDLAHLAQAGCLAEFRGAPIVKWFEFFRISPRLARQVVLKAIAVTNWLNPEEKDTERDATTCCLVCGEPALDRQALSVHMFRTHGLRRAIRSYVEGLECLVCGLRFQSRQRIIDHMAENKCAPTIIYCAMIRYRKCRFRRLTSRGGMSSPAECDSKVHMACGSTALF